MWQSDQEADVPDVARRWPEVSEPERDTTLEQLIYILRSQHSRIHKSHMSQKDATLGLFSHQLVRGD